MATVSATKAEVVKTTAEGVIRLVAIVKELKRELELQLQRHPFGVWLLAQEGIGSRTAASFLGEAGDLGRFTTEAKLARYAGVGAIKQQSGQSKERHWDGHRYNHRLKRALLLMAHCRAQYHQASSEFVRAHKLADGDYWKTIKKLARHLVRFLWRNWEKVVNGDRKLADEIPQET